MTPNFFLFIYFFGVAYFFLPPPSSPFDSADAPAPGIYIYIYIHHPPFIYLLHSFIFLLYVPSGSLFLFLAISSD